MEEEMKNSFITIKHHINGLPVEFDFELKSQPLLLSVQPGSADIILKNLFVSIDPYQINRMKTPDPSHPVSSVTPFIIPGQAIVVHGVAEVVDSDDAEYKKGDIVKGIIHWAEYSIVKARESGLRKIDNLEFPLTYYLGILGTSGLSAYAGLFDVGKVKEGDKVFVSAASGSVGSLVGQLAKLQGCYVVGSAGSDQKVALLKHKLGFDEAFNYNQHNDLKSTLAKYFPNGIDIYFDNVGDEMLEAAIANMNPFGKVVVCGVISEYTNSKSTKGRNGLSMVEIVYKRITIQGFIVSDYLNVFQDFKSMATGYLRSGEMKVIEDVSVGLHNIPSAFIGLFNGSNIGKKIVKLA